MSFKWNGCYNDIKREILRGSQRETINDQMLRNKIYYTKKGLFNVDSSLTVEMLRQTTDKLIDDHTTIIISGTSDKVTVFIGFRASYTYLYQHRPFHVDATFKTLISG